MDHEESHQMSASQSSHLSAHHSHGKPSNHAHSRPPSHRRRPLRRVNENSTLLRSPGPLESMLKTTTETGDIGIFSIKAIPPSVTYHHPPGPRPSFGDEGLLSRPHSRGVDDGFVHDDRRALPSYRDTTSEIISLYGSSTQPSNSRSFSPSLDDDRRSYSLTACGSRRLPSQKSSCTLQSFSSSGGLQRPRSPYPYPTRLKRPGVRPSSPAMTENGGIDYSKMVELDRVSYRTGSRSYKSTHYSSHRRPPPISMRPEFNRSMPSLSSRASPGPYHQGPGLHRSRTPSSMAPWGPRQPRRQPDCSDQSIRSASLTSIVEMYQRPIHTSMSGPPLRSAGSFYYDYTEDFEADPQSGLEFVSPLCPIPQRRGSIGRPMVLRGDCHRHLDVEDVPSELQESQHGKNTDKGYAKLEAKDQINSHHSTRSSSTTIGPRKILPRPFSIRPINDGVNDMDAMLLQTRRAGSRSAQRASLKVEIGNGSDTNLEPSPSPESTTSSSRSRLWQFSKSQDPEPEVTHPHTKQSFRYTPRKLIPVMNSTGLEAAAVIDTCDTSRRDLLDKQEPGMAIDADPEMNQASLEHGTEAAANQMRPPNSPSPTQRCVTAPGGERPIRKHQRDPTTTGMKFPDILDPDTLNRNLAHPVAKANTIILSPNPISPANQLKLTNSIPQLMKALPPLPQEAQQPSDSPCGSLSTEPDVSTALLFTSPTKSLLHFKCEEISSFLAPKALSMESNSEAVKASSRTRSSKFKIRMKSPRSPTIGRQPSLMGVPGGGSNDYKRPRLKLKISRSHLCQNKAVQHGTVVRSPELKQYSSLSDMGHHRTKDLFTSHCHIETVCFDKETQPGLAKCGLKAIHEASGLEPSPKTSDQFDIPYPPSPRRRETSTASQGQDAENEQQPGHRAVSSANRLGLRQKVSLLRLRVPRFSPPKTRKLRRGSCSSRSFRRSSSPITTPDKSLDGFRAASYQRGQASSSRPGKRHRRVRRWAVEARRAVRSCVRRTLERSSHSNGDD
ncbi:hypothetical protein B0J13DRAFT_21202 [Dactylonectria estremocensis]|uniref:Uncharacterized protein n=1 Tax=Dactylonectria estremocensis TaxID=1079267 RepID=A0A9P9FJW4_9HYPO|nr:hypothetical protein B0J13DRAFT_21202 [Dactylonectria estremocensis]